MADIYTSPEGRSSLLLYKKVSRAAGRASFLIRFLFFLPKNGFLSRSLFFIFFTLYLVGHLTQESLFFKAYEPDEIAGQVAQLTGWDMPNDLPGQQLIGLLEKGQLLTVRSYLVKRQKIISRKFGTHYGDDLIRGCDGSVWVGEHVDSRDSISEDPLNNAEQQHTKSNTNAIPILSTLGFNLTLEVISEFLYHQSSSFSFSFCYQNMELRPKHPGMLGSEFHVLVAEREAERRDAWVGVPCFGSRKRS
uniref:Uncharacterized protein n=1 Tax=Populus alba TaxID=43335 RepID=A0A4U5QTZ2_POPAL|nr:hypothetical protein D5086_0000041650 [Populus alba]